MRVRRYVIAAASALLLVGMVSGLRFSVFPKTVDIRDGRTSTVRGKTENRRPDTIGKIQDPHDLQIARLQTVARQKSYTGIAAQRVLETIFVQFGFYLQQQLTGPKRMVARSVAEMTRPSK